MAAFAIFLIGPYFFLCNPEKVMAEAGWSPYSAPRVFMLRNLIIMFLAVAVVIHFVPADWITTSNQRQMQEIEAATLNTMPSQIGVSIGLATGLAEACGYRFNHSAAEQAANLNGLRQEMLSAGGVSRHLWAEGYQQGLVFPRSDIVCENALSMFGSSGSIIPHLIAR